MSTQTAVAKAIRFSLFAFVSTSIPTMAYAADEAQATEQVERIEVTGSRIKRTDMENASPIVVMSAADIEKGGFNSVQDVLGNLSQNSGGSMTQQEVHGFTPAASSVNLRGVGAGRVLTLINGKRVPKYPFGAGGTDSFVDTANIPLGAIERIEILTTGASAIYGSDAMGGVINIILKKDVEQTTFKYRFSDTDEGGLRNNQFSFMTGVSSDTANLTFFAEYEDRTALKGTDRPEWGTDIVDGQPYSGYSSYGANLVQDLGNNKTELEKTLSPAECEARGYVVMENGRCGFDRSKQRDFLPEQKRYSTMINLTKELNADHQLYSRIDYTHSSTFTEIESATVGNDFMFNVAGDSVTIANKDKGMTQTFKKDTAFGGDFANAADGDYFYTRRMSELGPRTSDFETNNFSFIIGAKGFLTDSIEYDTSWSIARQTVESRSSGSPTHQAMFDYLTSGENGKSLMDVISPEDAALLNYEGNKKGQSTLSSFSAGINGDAFELAGGTAAYAVGLEYSKEWFYDKSDSFTSNGGVIGKGGSSAEGEREQYAAYAELALPLLDQLTMTLAGRYDYYDDESDVGGQFTPQVSLEYRPIDSLMLRALYAETFRAPDMQRLFGDPTTGYSTVIDTPRCEAYDECDKIESLPIAIGANPELEAEEGKNYNLGLVWDYEGINLTVDYWMVEIDNLVNDPSAQYILDHADAFADKIIRDSEGKLLKVNTQAMNMSSRETAGIDFSLGYRYETESYGEFSSRLEGTYLTRWKEKLTPDSEELDLIDGEGSAPQLRANLNLGWSYNDFSTNLLFKYIDSMNGERMDYFVENGLDSQYSVKVDSHVEVNLAASYFIYDNLKVSAGINNLFDSGPEIDYTQSSWPHYPRAYYNVIGREYYAGVEFTF
ncbi:TonB-dependent receptor plug domain-containing protein [Shewanella chilikensis]|uniref:TonB-dependent receptor plug domain-containing protein n=1 Tax=Shewanella chilikensis TaxID=558541 RepID=UPI003B6762B8